MKQISETSFEPDWLALREPADHAARDAGLLALAAACCRPGRSILDLGCGTGSTARAFAKAGLDHAAWRFFDNDPVLLTAALSQHPMAEGVRGSLADIEALPLDGVGLVTASALLDLMPASWVEGLAQRLARAGIPFYAALSYDGVMTWDPTRPEDAPITDAFNRHQQGDKGLGRAVGPRAGAVTTRIFAAYGFEIATAQSPWKLGPEQGQLHDTLLVGIGSAAAEAGAQNAAGWTAARRAAVARTQVVIGHCDLLAIPSSDRSRMGATLGDENASC